MKKELIKTDNYLLVVDDSEIKRGDWVYNQVSKEMYRFNENLVNYEKKVIAHLPINDSADLKGVPLLPVLEDDDSNKDLFYQKQVMNPYPTGGQSYASYEKGFVDGYNKAREECIKEIDKQISDFKHDLKESTSTFVKQNCEGAIFGLMRLKESLSQPKTPTHFEFEMEDKVALDGHTVIGKEIKTTANSQGQEVACGKYIY